MEWMNRGGRPTQPTGPQSASPVTGPSTVSNASGATTFGKKPGKFSEMKLASVVMLVAIALLVLALLAFGIFGGKSASGENKFVDDSKMQAVFLNGGQVYFGNISNLNSQYLRLADIYYLRVNQQVQPNQTDTQTDSDVSLVKLGCELHGPQDSMVINRDQIIFWENLKDDGQVAIAVKDYVKANPDGQNCETAAEGQATQPESTTGGSTTPPAATPPAATPTNNR